MVGGYDPGRFLFHRECYFLSIGALLNVILSIQGTEIVAVRFSHRLVSDHRMTHVVPRLLLERLRIPAGTWYARYHYLADVHIVER